ncbi:phosphatase PAP2 family protein [Modestobacter excelsi]|uniref:phosphatase PAP2 family protein n=1 Tax=Modestobacter excelsi TaxID=2213161 RepID=UPI00110D1134|nr:phosphatase PAP2 family protein [Modestobacter excelsi]
MSDVRAPGRRPTSPWWACAALLLAWVAVLGMVLTREGLAEEDGPTLRWLVQHRSGPLDRVFEAISSTPLDGAAAGLGAALVVLVAVRTRSLRPLLVLGASVAGAVVLAELVKTLVGRARPAAAVMLGAPETGSGFPSAHTLVLTALAGGVALVVWRVTSSALVRTGAVGAAAAAAVAIGISRLYLGDHWFTDVLASYALAGAVLAAVAALTPPRAAPA